MDDELLAKDNAIREFVENSIVPIIVDYDDSKTGERKVGILGTGTLFKFLDKYFLISAAHVLTETEGYDDYIAIPAGKEKSQGLTFKNCTRYFPKDEKQRDIFDIGIIALNNDLGKQIELNYRFLNEQNINFKIKQECNIYISGFPYKWGKFDEINNVLHGNPFRLMSKIKTHRRGYDKYDPKSHILVEYSEMYYSGGNEDKLVVAEQELGGISGSSMWSFDDNQLSVWSAEKCLKVIGIQSSLMKAEYIKGTKWAYMIDAFKHIDKNIYNLLSECKEKQFLKEDC